MTALEFQKMPPAWPRADTRQALTGLPAKISFQDFLERADADCHRFRSLVGQSAGDSGIRPRFLLPDFGETHVFHLGEDGEIQDAIAPIRDDLADDCRGRIPMPFKDVSCISSVPYQGQGRWILDRIIEDPAGRDAEPPDPERLRANGWTVKQRFFLVRQTELDRMTGIPVPTMWDVWFCGIGGARTYQLFYSPDAIWHEALKVLGMGHLMEKIFESVGRETVPILEQLAAVSHPQNYVVRVTPELTTKEAHRLARTGERPVRKSPHFIVVDHDVLVGISGRRGNGTHAGPVPHHRRGHWMRLAERCRLARLSGKEKVFVRPAYVGERSFADGKNRYEVLLDFGKPAAEKAGRKSFP